MLIPGAGVFGRRPAKEQILMSITPREREGKCNKTHIVTSDDALNVVLFGEAMGIYIYLTKSECLRRFHRSHGCVLGYRLQVSVSPRHMAQKAAS